MKKEDRQLLMKKFAENLPVFRSKIAISQDELAAKLGITRQTICAIENGQRTMTWSLFLALVLIFFRNQSTKRLLVALEIYTPELDDFLTVAGNNEK